MAKDWTDRKKEIDPETCKYCFGNSTCRKADGTIMTSKEWCTELDICAATIDWDRLMR